MTDVELRFNELITVLKEKEYRLTPQRMALVKLIASSKGHPSANEFYIEIKKKFPTMSHATVYKTLALLKELDQVYELNLRGDSHYDGNRPEPHPHLICTECSKIIDGEVDLDQEFLRKMEESSGFRILRPHLTLFGICAECLGQR